MKISKSSWHYRLLVWLDGNPTHNVTTCDYWLHFISVLIGTVGATLFAVLYVVIATVLVFLGIATVLSPILVYVWPNVFSKMVLGGVIVWICVFCIFAYAIIGDWLNAWRKVPCWTKKPPRWPNSRAWGFEP